MLSLMIQQPKETDRSSSGTGHSEEQGGDSPALKGLLPLLVLGTVLLYSVIHLYFNIKLYAWPIHGSDFLGSFPNHIIGTWFGDPERFYLYYPMDSHAMAKTYWNYGPVFHLLTLPMYLMPSAEFAYKFLLIQLGVAYLAGTGLILHTLRLFDIRSYPSIFAVLIILNFYPLYEGFTQRSIELFEVLLVAVGMYYYSRGRHSSAGIAIGLAAMTKFLPGVIILHFLIRRQWKALTSSLIVCTVSTVLAEWLFGWRNSWTWKLIVDIEGYDPSYFLGHPLNQALSGAIHRLTTHIGINPYAGAIVAIVTIVVVLLLAWWLYSRRETSDWMLEWNLKCLSVP